MAVRPERITLSTDKPDGVANSAQGEVREVSYLGDRSICHVEMAPGLTMRTTIDTRYVAVNGRVFDVDADMAEVGGKGREAPEFYWQRHHDGHTFGIEYGPTAPCHCPKSGTLHTH